MKSLLIRESDEGQTLIKYLRRVLKAADEGFLHRMLRKKNIKLNDKKADGKEILSADDQVKIFFSDETFEKLSGNAGNENADDISFRHYKEKAFEEPVLIYEDKDIILAEKPAGLLSQKAKDNDVSMNDILLSYVIKSGQISVSDFRLFHPSISNRLDRNTSGIILFAKTLKGQQALSKALKERTIKKYYKAIVHGSFNNTLRLDAWLLKDEIENKVIVKASPFEGARRISAKYSPVASGECSMIEIELITGAPHQIRAHLSSLGYPIVCDPKYGDRQLDEKAFSAAGLAHSKAPKRQLLHAARVVLPDGRQFEADLPDDMKKAKELLCPHGIQEV